MKVIDGGVTAAKGFSAYGLRVGIKEGNTEKKDMAMIYSKEPCVAAGTFTTNQVKAAPVKWDNNIVENSDFVHAVVCNSGVANACTGAEGMKYCEDMAEATATALNVGKDEVLVASTGVIGAQLPMEKITKALKCLCLN